MATIIGYTDSITECECCGKINLKGTYCLDIEGDEFYYGSVCAKNHNISTDEQKLAFARFSKEQKNAKLIALHIAPIIAEKAIKVAEYGNTAFELKLLQNVVAYYENLIKAAVKKYKIDYQA